VAERAVPAPTISLVHVLLTSTLLRALQSLIELLIAAPVRLIYSLAVIISELQSPLLAQSSTALATSLEAVVRSLAALLIS